MNVYEETYKEIPSIARINVTIHKCRDFQMLMAMLKPGIIVTYPKTEEYFFIVDKALTELQEVLCEQEDSMMLL